jgi:hypothetical protein
MEGHIEHDEYRQHAAVATNDHLFTLQAGITEQGVGG